MADHNNLILVGRVGGKMKKGKSSSGGSYLWFPIEIENAQGATSTDNNFHQGINVMCFKPKVLEYLERVGFKVGNRVVIFGFVSSFRQEIKGKAIVSNAVNATEVYVIKTQ